MDNPDNQLSPVGCADLLCCPFCGFEEPEIETHQNWCPNCGARGPNDLDAWGLEGEPNRPRSAQAAWNKRHDDRWTIEAAKAAVNTLVSENERLRDARAKAENGECLLELTIGMMEQDIATIREIITKGGTAADILKFLDTPNA